MKKIKKILFAMILPVVAIGGCATGYEKEGIFTNGYSDFQTSSNTFVVTFRANEHTPSDKVFKYAVRRAAELTRKHGFQYFTIIDQTGTGKHLPYPSLRLTIQCSHTPSDTLEWIDARLH